jgi:hypothetical protein
MRTGAVTTGETMPAIAMPATVTAYADSNQTEPK